MTSQRMTSILSYNGQVLKKVRETNCFTHLNNNRHAYIGYYELGSDRRKGLGFREMLDLADLLKNGTASAGKASDVRPPHGLSNGVVVKMFSCTCSPISAQVAKLGLFSLAAKRDAVIRFKLRDVVLFLQRQSCSHVDKGPE